MGHSPKKPKQTNSLATRGNSILKTFLSKSLKTKPKPPTTTGKKMPNPQSEDNLVSCQKKWNFPGLSNNVRQEASLR